MGVEGHHKLCGRHAGPHTEVEAVATHHPPQEQVETLAGAPRRRSRKEVAHAGPLGNATSICMRQIERECSPRETVERRSDVFDSSAVTLEKKPFDGSGLFDHLLHHPDESHEIDTADPPVDDRLELASFARGFELSDIARGLVTHHGENPLDRLQHTGYTAEGQ